VWKWKLISAVDADLLSRTHGATTTTTPFSVSIKALEQTETLEFIGSDVVSFPGESHRSESFDTCVELGDSTAEASQFEGGVELKVVQIRASIRDEAIRNYGLKLSSSSKMDVWAKLTEAHKGKHAIAWKKRVRKGLAEYTTSGITRKIPFRITTGLEYDIQAVN
jgi:hypothetical protein